MYYILSRGVWDSYKPSFATFTGKGDNPNLFPFEVPGDFFFAIN